MKKYQTSHWNIEIKEVEVVRETDNFIILSWQYGIKKERREAKHSEYHLYHDTWEAAHAYLLHRAEERVDQSKNELERWINELRIIENTKKGN